MDINKYRVDGKVAIVIGDAGDIGKANASFMAVRGIVSEHGKQMTKQAEEATEQVKEIGKQIAEKQSIVNVQPAPVNNVIVDKHPKRAVQTVERDDNDEITRTIITYED